MNGKTVRLTMGQAVVDYLQAQYSEHDGATRRLTVDGQFSHLQRLCQVAYFAFGAASGGTGAVGGWVDAGGVTSAGRGGSGSFFSMSALVS